MLIFAMHILHIAFYNATAFCSEQNHFNFPVILTNILCAFLLSIPSSYPSPPRTCLPNSAFNYSFSAVSDYLQTFCFYISKFFFLSTGHMHAYYTAVLLSKVANLMPKSTPKFCIIISDGIIKLSIYFLVPLYHELVMQQKYGLGDTAQTSCLVKSTIFRFIV